MPLTRSKSCQCSSHEWLSFCFLIRPITTGRQFKSSFRVTSLLPVMQTVVMGSTGVQREDSCWCRNYWITWVGFVGLAWSYTHLSGAEDWQRRCLMMKELRKALIFIDFFLNVKGDCMYECMYACIYLFILHVWNTWV